MADSHIKLWQIMYELDEDGEELLDEIYDDEFEEDVEVEQDLYDEYNEEEDNNL